MSDELSLQHKGRKIRRGQDRRLRSVLDPPPGLKELQLEGKHMEELLERSLAEVEAILHDRRAGELRSTFNQHFFINLPFPFSALTTEESTPLFSFGAARVAALSDLIMSTLDELGFSSAEKADLLPRANAIVREYRPGQQISFHVDDDECDELVIGVVLLNDSSAGKPNGLHFRKGEGTHTLEYVLDERRGTAFMMEQKARYSWQHGLPPVPARRISLTVRFFKHRVLKESLVLRQKNTPELPSSLQSLEVEPLPNVTAMLRGSAETELLPNATEVEASQGEVRVTLVMNSNLGQRKPAILLQPTSLAQLAKLCKNKLRVTGVRFYDGEGCEVHDGRILSAGSEVYVCRTQSEHFSGTHRVQSRKLVQNDSQSGGHAFAAADGTADVQSKNASVQLSSIVNSTFPLSADPPDA